MTSPENPVRRGRITMALAISILSTALLIWSEIWAVAAAAIWSIASLFGGSITSEIVLAVLIVPVALWASVKTLQLVWSSESELAETNN